MSDRLFDIEVEAATIAAEIGMEQAERGADDDWLITAWETLVEYLRTHQFFFVDDFWRDSGLERPRESRALGPLVLKAARLGLIRKTEVFRKSVASHMTEKPIWKSLTFEARK